jgi:hypothetical protein
MSKILRSPTDNEIMNLISEYNWIYLDSGDDGGVFDSEVLESKPVSNTRFNIKVRTYENWSNLEDSEPIIVSGYLFDFDVLLDPESDTWMIEGESFLDPVEFDEVELSQLPNNQELSSNLIERNYGDWEQEDLNLIKPDSIDSSIRPFFLEWLSDRPM